MSIRHEDIEALELAPVARRAANLLRSAHPSVVFTSGRRNLRDQARAMAQNIARNRFWIDQTYRRSEAAMRLQAWVDANPHRKTVAEIEEGLHGVMVSLAPAVIGLLSKHLSGMAFDVAPVAGAAGEEIKATIRELPGLDRFLEKEGGLVRWHAQFRDDETDAT